MLICSCCVSARSLDQLNSPGALGSPGFGVQTDPCSRETVLNVLRESRKRDVDDEDRSHAAGQKSKRRYILKDLLEEVQY